MLDAEPARLPLCETTIRGHAFGCRASLSTAALAREYRPCQPQQHENHVIIPLNLHDFFVVGCMARGARREGMTLPAGRLQ